MKRYPFFVMLFCISVTFEQVVAQVKLPRLVSDSMILQRDVKLTLWGWASAGEKVALNFKNKIYKTTTGKDGKWLVTLPPMKAGGPYTLTIDASNHLSLRDILVGDVWLCAGQSNMVHQMELHSVRYADEVANANYPEIRHFTVPNIANMQAAQEDLPGGSWKWANPLDVRRFSAVAYFFAKKLYDEYRVPIGLINASWGGTPIEAWMSEDALKAFPGVVTTVQRNKDSSYINGLNNRMVAGPPQSLRNVIPDEDKGLTEKWFAPSYVAKNWRSVNVPGYWEDQGIRDLDGIVWYRKEIDVPAGMTNAPSTVFLGRIVDADVLYINGQRVGTTTYLYPQRRYTVPKGLLKAGKNLFVVRVTNNAGKGGFVPDKPYQLIAGNDTIGLRGEWQYKVGQVFVPSPATGNTAGSPAAQNQPTALYNSMLAPLLNYAVKGFLWYQGESNTSRPNEYALLQPDMIADWRTKWRAPNAPFIFVQLPGFGDMSYLPLESQWAAFREAQAKSLSVPRTAMAVAIDLGEWNDIHPDRKKEVGERLALAAATLAYGNTGLVSSGPLYKSSSVSGDKITINFSNAGTGLIANDDEELTEFAIAGADKKFIWGKAKIEGDKVIVWNEALRNPMYVRYAWADNPVNPNLCNREGLPASPFRTDQ
jgi:sialate O-acetylesterase